MIDHIKMARDVLEPFAKLADWHDTTIRKLFRLNDIRAEGPLYASFADMARANGYEPGDENT